MLNLSTTDQVCVDYYEIHHIFVNRYGIDKLDQKVARIYLRGEEIVNSLFNN